MYSSFIYGGNAELLKSLSMGNTALKVTQLAEWIRQAAFSSDESNAIISFAKERVLYLFSVISRNDAELDTLNAAELIFHFIQCCHEKRGMEEVLAGALYLLIPSKYPISQAVAVIFKRICELCMARDITQTNSAVAQCMTPELIDGVVMHLGSSSIVSEALMELFGAHIMFAKFFQEDFSPASLTLPWIKFGFPKAVVKGVLEALNDPDKYLIVLFLKEVCTLGLNPAVEPLVDAFLEKDLLDSLLTAAYVSCKEFLSHSGRTGSPVLEVLDIFAMMLRLVRQNFPPPDSVFQYKGSILEYSPVSCMCGSLDNFVDLLRIPNSSVGETLAFSRVRLSICSVIKELLLFQINSIDEKIRDSCYFDALINISRRFPNNNAAAQILGESFSAMFARAKFEKRSNSCSSDVLLKYLFSMRGVQHILQICKFASNDSYGLAPIRSHSFRVLQVLLAKEWLIAELPPDVKENAEAAVATMNLLLERELSGKGFEEKGSAGVSSPVNEEVSNFAGVKDLTYPLRNSPDIEEEKREECESPSSQSCENESQDNFLIGDLTSDQVQAYPSFCNVMLAFAEKTDDE